jgi:hypothetical protein
MVKYFTTTSSSLFFPSSLGEALSYPSDLLGLSSLSSSKTVLSFGGVGLTTVSSVAPTPRPPQKILPGIYGMHPLPDQLSSKIPEKQNNTQDQRSNKGLIEELKNYLLVNVYNYFCLFLLFL